MVSKLTQLVNRESLWFIFQKNNICQMSFQRVFQSCCKVCFNVEFEFFSLFWFQLKIIELFILQNEHYKLIIFINKICSNKSINKFFRTRNYRIKSQLCHLANLSATSEIYSTSNLNRFRTTQILPQNLYWNNNYPILTLTPPAFLIALKKAVILELVEYLSA